MKTFTILATLALIVILSLSLTGCGLLSSLQVIVDVTAAAVPVLEAAGVPIPPEVPTYIGDVASCIGSQTGTPSTAQLIAIASCLAAKVTPTLGPGIPSAIVNIVSQIAADVATYVAQFKATSTDQTKVVGTLTSGQAVHLMALRAKARDTALKCAALKK